MITTLLAAIPAGRAPAYETYFSDRSDMRAHIVSQVSEAVAALADRERIIDVLVLDNALDRAYDLVTQLRKSYPRLIIVLVDEGADFATPGQADEISTDPFTDDDLVRRIQRLLADRGLETLRADAMPPIREFARMLRKAVGDIGKYQAAVSACRTLGYDYVAFYALDSEGRLTLSAQEGGGAFESAAPLYAAPDDIVSWVAKTGQSRTTSHGDTLSHRLIERGLLTMAACSPVGRTNRYGVLYAGHISIQPIQQQQVLLLELISAQLAAVLSKEQ